MDLIIKILNEIRSTASTKEKQAILKKNENNELLKKVLEYTYNPFKRYKITEKMIEDIPSYVGNPNQYSNIFDLLFTLGTSNINNNLRTEVNTFLFNYKEEERELYIGMLTKDLKLGCNVSTINNVWKNLIPKFDVMLAEKYHDNIKKS